MPTSTFTSKTKVEYPDVKWKVEGSLDDLSTDALKALATKYLAATGRAYVAATLNEAEPAILKNKALKDAMVKKGFPTETVESFFSEQKLYTEIPTEFVIPITELVPDGSSGRGKKAANVFTFDEKDEENQEVSA